MYLIVIEKTGRIPWSKDKKKAVIGFYDKKQSAQLSLRNRFATISKAEGERRVKWIGKDCFRIRTHRLLWWTDEVFRIEEGERPEVTPEETAIRELTSGSRKRARRTV